MEDRYLEECIRKLKQTVLKEPAAPQTGMIYPVVPKKPPMDSYDDNSFTSDPPTYMSTNGDVSSEALYYDAHDESDSDSDIVDASGNVVKKHHQLLIDALDAMIPADDEMDDFSATWYLICENDSNIFVCDQKEVNGDTSIGSTVTTRFFTATIIGRCLSEENTRHYAEVRARSYVSFQ